jgi:UV DNA damage endonuclease
LTCRLANATPKRLEELTRLNLERLAAILEWNAVHDIRLYRISSNTIPFGSHPEARFPWRERLAPELDHLAEILRREAIRVSMHPSQYIVLNSPNPLARKRAVAELVYHAELLDALRTDVSNKIVLHVGGAYGDKRRAAEVFVNAALDLPDAVGRRLVIENDDTLYDLSDVLAISERTGLPVVLDLFHHQVLPSLPGLPPDELAALAAVTWRQPDGRPKIHFSRQAPGKRPGAHARSFRPAAARPLFELLARRAKRDRRTQGPLGRGLDVLLECKDKETAVLRLRAALPDLR